MSHFLLEIGTEEIPARMIASATDELQRRIAELVTRERLSATASVEAYSSPRRIAVLVHGLAASQPDIAEQLLGPAMAHAYKNGAAHPGRHRLRQKGRSPARRTHHGHHAQGRIPRRQRASSRASPRSRCSPNSCPKEIAALYWAKNMYWRPGKPERFVRPVRWLVALLDGEIVPLEFGGITAGRTSRGHRILAPAPVTLASPAEYAEKLRAAHVLPSYAEREHKIRKALDAAVRQSSRRALA